MGRDRLGLLGAPERRGRGRVERHRGHEAVAAAVDGLDERRLLRIVAQDLAELAHGLRQRGLGDVRVLPNGVHQRLLGYDAARTRDEVLKDAQDARRQRELHAVSGQDAVGAVETESAEPDRLAGRVQDDGCSALAFPHNDLQGSLRLPRREILKVRRNLRLP